MDNRLNTGRKQSRNSNIELLRILSMFMILGHHFAGHGQFNWGGGRSFSSVLLVYIPIYVGKGWG